MAETQEQSQEAPPKKAVKVKGWDRSARHYGVFTDFRGRQFAAYMEFNETDVAADRGWRVYCTATRLEFKPGAVFLDERQMKLLKLSFKLDGQAEDVTKPIKHKLESKSQRNRRLAAAAPKTDEDEA